MKASKLIAGVAIAGGLAAGAMGLSTGVASAAPGVAPVPTDWGHHPGPPPGPGWGGPGPGWGGPGPVGWAPPPPPPYYGGGPIPGGWNGGWEPNGGLCLGPFCV